MRQIKLFLLIVVFFCQSCAGPQVVNTPTEEITNMPAPNVLIDPMAQRGSTVALSVGDVFAVALPKGSSIWKVDYAGSVVEPLTLPENMEEPGSQGWLFRAVAAGQTDIRLTASTAPCTGPDPCPPAPPITFVFTVDVK